MAEAIGQAGFELHMLYAVQFLEAVLAAAVVQKQRAIAEFHRFVGRCSAFEEDFVVAFTAGDNIGTGTHAETVVTLEPVEEVIAAPVLQLVRTVGAQQEGRCAVMVGGGGLFVADPGKAAADGVEIADDDGAVAFDVIVEGRLGDTLDRVDENAFQMRGPA